ncbi:hypothetical protein PYCH_11790 [Pyrococcus yayanosii CH1]|uniref:DUF996 domain-containing protein n=2 Tax=Pyrococcus TaxID=2260 RepID=F8AJ56_PYRYC|nr:hypothetical protein PYCH_11790 [Pyrococcus yayanosii CH1]
MTLKDAKLYGGIGAILGLIGGLVPRIGFVLSLAGLVLIFMAVKKISDETGDKDIFDDFLKAFIIQIGGIVLAAIIAIATVGAFILGAGIEGMMREARNIAAILGGVLIALVILWIALVIATYFRKRSYERIAERTGTDLFRTTGLLYFIGAITMVVLVGLLVIFVAAILEIVSFFSLPDELERPEETTAMVY